MDDENINPYEPSPTLTVNQAVMYMLGYRSQYSYMVDTDNFEFDLSEYLYALQEKADCACGNALPGFRSCEMPTPRCMPYG
jgi:hypothetical protein